MDQIPFNENAMWEDLYAYHGITKPEISEAQHLEVVRSRDEERNTGAQDDLHDPD